MQDSLLQLEGANPSIERTFCFMIFAVATDERTLVTFESEESAVSACEGLDVEAADWLFWDDRGNPLEPLFSVVNKRGLFLMQNGVYSLVPAKPGHHASLDETLNEILNFASCPPFNSAEGVREYLARKVAGNEA